MSRSLSFRPQLETLEGRELPSAFGGLLFFQGQQLQAQNTKVNNDFSTLKTDIGTFTTTPSTTNAMAVTGANASLQTDFTTLKNQAKNEQNLLFFSLFSGQLQQSDGLFVLIAFNDLNQANTTIKNLPGQVAAQGTAQFDASPFSVNTALSLVLGTTTTLSIS
jgi:hypothetical protein